MRQAPVLLHVAGRPKPVMGDAEVEDQTQAPDLEYRAQTGIWRLLDFVSVRTIKGRSIEDSCVPRHRRAVGLRLPSLHAVCARRVLGLRT